MSIAEPADFDTIFQRLFRPLRRQVARMVGCDHVAEDLVQDVFLSMWRHRAAIDVRGDVTSYLRRSVRNRALDYLRRERLQRRWQESVSHEGERASEPDAAFGQDESIDATLDDLFADMPPRRREVCQLRWRSNLRPPQIAERLGIALKTVEAHITLGTKHVRARLQVA